LRVFLPTSVLVLAKSGCQPTSWGEGHTRRHGTTARMARSLLDTRESVHGSLA
jgi:hypothetical protein